MPKQWRLYSAIMLVALSLGIASGGLLALVGVDASASAPSSVASDSQFSSAALLIDDGAYVGGLLAPDSSGQVVYISAAGDSVSGIAARFGVSADALAAANGLSAGDKLDGGEQLIIPAGGARTAPSSIKAPSRPLAPGEQPAAAQPAAPPAAQPAAPAAAAPAHEQPAAVPAQAAPAAAVAPARVMNADADGNYTIQSGDTLSGIAERFNVSIADLANANGIVDPSQIYGGTKLTIPGKSQLAPAVAPAKEAAQPAQPEPVKAALAQVARPVTQPSNGKYAVQAGDNLGSIAAQHGVTVDAIVAANDISDANVIVPGETIVIPGTAQPIAKPKTVVKQPAAARLQPATRTPPPPKEDGLFGAVNKGNGSNRWIDVNISTQTLTAYEGDTAVFRSAVSTGVDSHPTVVGRYNIWAKLRYDDMAGPGYYLPDVPYTMYFYSGYAIHGTYWHHNFGTPMSHGCVNLPTDAAGWVFNWASVGTQVVTHY